MSEQRKPVRQLPVSFDALDLEGRTKAVPLVACPRVGAERQPLALCGRCGNCEQVRLESGSEFTLTCAWSDRDERAQADCATRWVHEFARVPALCVALDTRMSVLTGLFAQDASDPVPVLNRDAVLIGIVHASDFHAALAAPRVRDRSVVDVMSAAPPRIRFDAAAVDAQRLLSHDDTPCLAVVGAHGRFLGLLTREDLRVA
jgi:CBS-domain-containing membrane protein